MSYVFIKYHHAENYSVFSSLLKHALNFYILSGKWFLFKFVNKCSIFISQFEFCINTILLYSLSDRQKHAEIIPWFTIVYTLVKFYILVVCNKIRLINYERLINIMTRKTRQKWHIDL